MQVTTESRRIRWIGLGAAWCAVALLLYFHTVVFRGYIDVLDHVALRGAKVAPTPLKRVCPKMYADAQMWVRHALALAHGAGPQMRFTHVDNAPFGREVHWDSGFAWLIVGAGWLQHLVTGETFTTAVEQSLAWFNLPLLMAFIFVLTIWVSRRAGLGAGVLLAFAMIGNWDFYSGFAPNYVDHHGVLAAAVLGLVLGSLFMGVGFWRRNSAAVQLLPASEAVARRAAIFSAVSGAYGMWVSAPTLIPAIAIVGFAGAVTIILFGGKVREQDVVLEPAIWRLWGKVGAVGCCVFYLLEYAPSHLGWRLEVNHPLYAAGWWGGSEIIAQIAEWRQLGRQFRPRLVRLGLAIMPLIAVPLIIALAGSKVFVVFDPFITRLSQHVAEGITLFKAVQLFGTGRLWLEVPWTAAAFVLGVIAWWRSRGLDRALLVFALLATLAFTAMAMAQIRWWASAAGPQICLLMLAIAAVTAKSRNWVRWGFVAAAVGGLCLPTAISRVTAQQNINRHRTVDRGDVFQALFRDVAAVLRASQPEGKIVVLASPNTSAGVGYYGDFQTIGTLYWENLAGTKAAAEMFSAESMDDARKLLRARGVTHVVMISEDNFLGEYFELLHPGADQTGLKASFGYQLLVEQNVPMWLERIPYDIPPDFPARDARVLLFKTRFSAPAAESLYENALQAFGANRMAEGEADLNAALELAPNSAEFLVTQANLLLLSGNVNAALATAQKAVDNAVPSQQTALCGEEANRFYRQHAHAAAAALYVRAENLHADDNTMNNLAWLLATSPDQHVRNGAEALRIAKALTTAHPEHTFVTAYAAALAECGLFDSAIAAQKQVLQAIEPSGDKTAIATAQARLSAYEAHRPWRE